MRQSSGPVKISISHSVQEILGFPRSATMCHAATRQIAKAPPMSTLPTRTRPWISGRIECRFVG